MKKILQNKIINIGFVFFSLLFLLPIPVVAGVVDQMSGYSLHVLSVVLGSVDGFNVCSLGALVLIISLVLVFKSRKLILIAGMSFILTTVIVYGILIAIWHQIFFYITPYQSIFELFLGSVALIGGLYFTKVFIDSIRFGPTCGTQGSTAINWAVRKIEQKFKKGGYWAIFTGAVLFASVVAIVEFPCSAALPLTFVGILADANISITLFALYTGIYLLAYMLIEILVFLVAFFTKKLWIASPKAIIVSSALAAIILFIIAAQYLFGFVIISLH